MNTFDELNLFFLACGVFVIVMACVIVYAAIVVGARSDRHE